MLKLHEVGHTQVPVAVLLHSVHNDGDLAAVAVGDYLNPPAECLLLRACDGVVGRLAVRGLPLREFAPALQGEDTDAPRRLAVALEVQGPPYLLTGAPERLHQEGLRLVVCQYLLFHNHIYLMLSFLFPNSLHSV